MIKSIVNNRAVKLVYTNHQNVTSIRNVLPRRLWFGVTEWHTEEQWLLEVYDLDKKQTRNFALRDIQKWK